MSAQPGPFRDAPQKYMDAKTDPHKLHLPMPAACPECFRLYPTGILTPRPIHSRHIVPIAEVFFRHIARYSKYPSMGTGFNTPGSWMPQDLALCRDAGPCCRHKVKNGLGSCPLGMAHTTKPAVNYTAIEMKRRYGRNHKVELNGSRVYVLDCGKSWQMLAWKHASASPVTGLRGCFISECGGYPTTWTIFNNRRRGPSNSLCPG